MRKTIRLALVILVLAGCRSGQQKIERTTDEGVEVVLNHLEPYVIKGIPSRLILEKEFSIDTENEETVKIGLTEMETFDVDSEGYIYIMRWQSNENYVFKYDSAGNFVTSFLRRGQGPGELEWGGTVMIDHEGNVLAKDPSKPRYAVYNRDGGFVKEVLLKKPAELIAPLSNGQYFWWQQIQEPEMVRNLLGVSDSSFESFREIYREDTPNPFRSSEAEMTVSMNLLVDFNCWLEFSSWRAVLINCRLAC